MRIVCYDKVSNCASVVLYRTAQRYDTDFVCGGQCAKYYM